MDACGGIRPGAPGSHCHIHPQKKEVAAGVGEGGPTCRVAEEVVLGFNFGITSSFKVRTYDVPHMNEILSTINAVYPVLCDYRPASSVTQNIPHPVSA